MVDRDGGDIRKVTGRQDCEARGVTVRHSVLVVTVVLVETKLYNIEIVETWIFLNRHLFGLLFFIKPSHSLRPRLPVVRIVSYILLLFLLILKHEGSLLDLEPVVQLAIVVQHLADGEGGALLGRLLPGLDLAPDGDTEGCPVRHVAHGLVPALARGPQPREQAVLN